MKYCICALINQSYIAHIAMHWTILTFWNQFCSSRLPQAEEQFFFTNFYQNKLFKMTKYKMYILSHRISNQTWASFPPHAKIYSLSQIWQTTVDAAAVTAKMLALRALTIHHDTSDLEGKSITQETIWEPLPGHTTLPNGVFRQLRSHCCPLRGNASPTPF